MVYSKLNVKLGLDSQAFDIKAESFSKMLKGIASEIDEYLSRKEECENKIAEAMNEGSESAFNLEIEKKEVKSAEELGERFSKLAEKQKQEE